MNKAEEQALLARVAKIEGQVDTNTSEIKTLRKIFNNKSTQPLTEGGLVTSLPKAKDESDGGAGA